MKPETAKRIYCQYFDLEESSHNNEEWESIISELNAVEAAENETQAVKVIEWWGECWDDESKPWEFVRYVREEAAYLEPKTEFDAWFVAQFGRRPKMTGVQDDELSSVASKGREAQHMIELQREWDAQQHAASMAWNNRNRPPSDKEMDIVDKSN